MSQRIDLDHGRFRQIIRGKIKQNLRKYISQGEMIAKKGKDTVAIPLPSVDIPHFKHGDKQQGGVGQGQGDVVFHKEGGYWCLWAGQQWIGYWQLEGRRLLITEGKVPDRPDSVPQSQVRWTVELDAGATQGEVVHEGRRFTFRLSRTP